MELKAVGINVIATLKFAPAVVIMPKARRALALIIYINVFILKYVIAFPVYNEHINFILNDHHPNSLEVLPFRACAMLTLT